MTAMRSLVASLAVAATVAVGAQERPRVQDPAVAAALEQAASAPEAPEPVAGSQETVPPAGLQENLVQLPETTTDLEEEALRLVEQILAEQNIILAGQNFVYRADSRRDPFRNLLKLRQRELVAPAERPPGLSGFLIGEISVSAVARYQDRWHALVQGMDRRSYFVEVGTAMYDGRVVEINEQEIVFEQEVEDLLGARSTRRVVKKLSSETEE